MRESRTYGSGRGACHEMHVPTATDAALITKRTPHRAERALFGHSAPTSDIRRNERELQKALPMRTGDHVGTPYTTRHKDNVLNGSVDSHF